MLPRLVPARSPACVVRRTCARLRTSSVRRTGDRPRATSALPIGLSLLPTPRRDSGRPCLTMFDVLGSPGSVVRPTRLRTRSTPTRVLDSSTCRRPAPASAAPAFCALGLAGSPRPARSEPNSSPDRARSTSEPAAVTRRSVGSSVAADLGRRAGRVRQRSSRHPARSAASSLPSAVAGAPRPRPESAATGRRPDPDRRAPVTRRLPPGARRSRGDAASGAAAGSGGLEDQNVRLEANSLP